MQKTNYEVVWSFFLNSKLTLVAAFCIFLLITVNAAESVSAYRVK